MQSYLNRLTPFFLFILNHLLLPSPELDQILFHCSQAHILTVWLLETRLISMLLLAASEFFFIITFHGPRRKKTVSLLLGRSVYITVAYQRKLLVCCLRIRCCGNMVSSSLPSNGRFIWFHYSGFLASCHSILFYYTYSSRFIRSSSCVYINVNPSSIYYFSLNLIHIGKCSKV
jgi:hypothetical protein